jgi:N-methylhydantoinase A
MEADGRDTLAREGVLSADMAFLRQADLRYVGQSFELTVPLPAGELGSQEAARVAEAFHREHERAYGHCAPNEPVEWVSLRLTALGRIAKPRLREWPANDPNPALARKESRPVYFAEAGGFTDCPIFDRYRLPAGVVVAGPAVVEELDSTTVIHPSYRAQVDRFGNLLLGTQNVKQ